MPLITRIPVHGRWTLNDTGDSPASGTVTFTATTTLRKASDDTVILPGRYTAQLDTNGEIQLELPATDDPAISPNGWAWTVQEQFRHHSRRWYLQVPAATSGVLELADTMPLASPPSLGVWARIRYGNELPAGGSEGDLFLLLT